MIQKTSFLTLVVASLLAAPALAQDAAAPAAAPEAAPAAAAPEAAPAAAAPEAAPAAAPAEAAPAEAAPAEAAPAAAPAAAAPAEAAAEPVTPPPPAEGEGEDEEKVECVLGELCFGPVLTGGVFNVIGLGVHARYGEYWGFGLDYQFFSLSASGVDAGLGLFTLDGRLYPFAGAFFLSAGFSYQSASLEVSTTGATGSKAKITGDIGIPQIKFGLGFMGHDGFIMGIDLALGIPLGSSDADISVSGGSKTDMAIADKIVDVEDAADTLVSMLPVTFQLNLLRIGYLF